MYNSSLVGCTVVVNAAGLMVVEARWMAGSNCIYCMKAFPLLVTLGLARPNQAYTKQFNITC